MKLRTLYRQGDDIKEYTFDTRGRLWSEIDTVVAESLVASGSAILYESQDILIASMSYSVNRYIIYPGVREQLDMLFHELETSGSLTTSGSWFKAVKAVKDAHPKPE